MRRLAFGRGPALVAAACVLAAAAAPTAIGAPAKKHKGHSRPAARWTCPKKRTRLIDRLADGEIRRLQTTIYAGRADYASTTNISNHAATANQATIAQSASSAPIATLDYVASSATFNYSTAPSLTVKATCSSGTDTIGGGAQLSDPADSQVVDSAPTGTAQGSSGPTGWQADGSAASHAADGSKLTVTAICASAASVER